MFGFGRNMQYVLRVNHTEIEPHALNNGGRRDHQGI